MYLFPRCSAVYLWGAGPMLTPSGEVGYAWTWDDGALSTGLLWVAVLLLLTVGQAYARAGRWRVTLWERLPGEVQGVALALLVLAASAFHVDQVAFLYFQF